MIYPEEDGSSKKEITEMNILLIKNRDESSEKPQNLYTLHPSAHLSPKLVSFVIVKQALSVLKSMGYEGAAVVTSPYDLPKITELANKAVKEKQLAANDLVAVGFSQFCTKAN